jgi:ankyrin repeat protein
MEVTGYMVMEASQAGDLELLRMYGRQGVRVPTEWALRDNVTTTRTEGSQDCPLEVAICLVQELGADVNQREAPWHSAFGDTPLIIAAYEGTMDMVRCLVKLGADVNKFDNDGITALVGAAAEGRLDIVRFLVESGASIEVADNHRDTALQHSVSGGHYLTAQFLLEHAGANIESVG